MQKNQKPASGLSNILINVIIPVVILHRLSGPLGPGIALLLALAFPIGKGLWDLLILKHLNYFAILGLLNVSMTGSLALLGLDGIWFSVKEAVFPSLIGVFVIGSSFTGSPFIQSLLITPQLMNLERIHQELETLGRWNEFARVLRRSTQLLGCTFFVSAVCNFILAQRIFIPLDPSLDSVARSTALNQQIAIMSAWAMGVILVPSVIMLSVILWFLLKGIRETTGLRNEEILKA